jgi:hypothetical protein
LAFVSDDGSPIFRPIIVNKLLVSDDFQIGIPLTEQMAQNISVIPEEFKDSIVNLFLEDVFLCKLRWRSDPHLSILVVRPEDPPMIMELLSRSHIEIGTLDLGRSSSPTSMFDLFGLDPIKTLE